MVFQELERYVYLRVSLDLYYHFHQTIKECPSGNVEYVKQNGADFDKVARSNVCLINR